MNNRKLRMGMIGGGPGAFIGAVHRSAAFIDGEVELVCGVFSSDPEKSKSMSDVLHLSSERVYGSYQEMISAEKNREDKIDFVSIVTPNHLHFEPAKLALENGFHVVLDKPMTLNLKEALELEKIVNQSGKYFCLTHTYTGYPMIKEARFRILRGDLGKIRKIISYYPQGWLSEPEEHNNYKQAIWRTDPSKSGIAGCIGDIGTHAFNLAEYVSGLKLTQLCADIHTYVEGRKLDDDGSVILRFDNNASGILYASQIMAGEENDLTIKVYGEKGGIEWSHSENNTLLVKWMHQPAEVVRTGNAYLSSFARHNTRTPAGHPEGYLEAFANHYRNFVLCIKAEMQGKKPEKEWLDFPGIIDGVRGMNFIEKVISSSKTNEKWTEF